MEPNFVRWHLCTLQFDTAGYRSGDKSERRIRVRQEETVIVASKNVSLNIPGIRGIRRMSQFALQPNRGYGWQMIPGYTGEYRVPYCCPEENVQFE